MSAMHDYTCTLRMTGFAFRHSTAENRAVCTSCTWQTCSSATRKSCLLWCLRTWEASHARLCLWLSVEGLDWKTNIQASPGGGLASSHAVCCVLRVALCAVCCACCLRCCYDTLLYYIQGVSTIYGGFFLPGIRDTILVRQKNIVN